MDWLWLKMTHEEAKNLKAFKNYCTCGGFATRMNKRDKANPHMPWCPQIAEWKEWYNAFHEKEETCQTLQS